MRPVAGHHAVTVAVTIDVQLLRQQTWHVCLHFTHTHTHHAHTHCPRSPPPVALPEGMGHHHRQCGRHGDHGGLHLADRQPCVGNNAAVLLPSLPLTHTHTHAHDSCHMYELLNLYITYCVYIYIYIHNLLQ